MTQIYLPYSDFVLVAKCLDNKRLNPLHKAGDYCLQELNKQDLRPIKPDWFNNSAIYSTYRSALLYKDYDHYSKFGWSESPIIPIEENGKLVIPYIYGEGIKEKIW